MSRKDLLYDVPLTDKQIEEILSVAKEVEREAEEEVEEELEK